MTVNEYKCPNCSGAVTFDSGIQKMKCPYCDAEFEISAVVEYQKERAAPAADKFGWAGSEGGDWESGELDALAVNTCSSCGAEIVGDKNTVATVCPYCGNTHIVQAGLKGMLRPDYVIPFKLDKKAAKAALEKFQEKKRLLPKFFKQESRVDSITAIYVPFWLFDADTAAHIRYKATKVKHWSDSRYSYTKTSYYSCVRDGALGFKRVPVDGSEKMDDAYMDAIEPFDYTQMVDFSSAYLSGFLADKYDVDAEQSKLRANERIKKTVESEFRKTVSGYNSLTVESSSVQFSDGTVHYALFPVWMLNTKYLGVMYTFAMNGQTGKLIGKLPVDKGRFWGYLLGIAGIIGGIVTALLLVLRHVL
ncbi:TFIIB-type zinc ribbon-containing protein [Breznakiellaceae bacterium SP9]